MTVATNVIGERDPDGAGLDGVLHALRALCPGVGVPSCCTWACSSVVGDVRRRRRGVPTRIADPAPGVLGFPDLEFEAVLVRRLAHRYLKVVADAEAGRPVPRTWQLLLDPPPAPPIRLAVAGVGTLLAYDLTLAAVGACTVLGRTPGAREHAAHGRVAAVLGTCFHQLVRCGDPAGTAAAGRLDGPAACATAWGRAEHLWTLRGRPAEAETERDALDREVRDSTARLLAEGGPGVENPVGRGTVG